MKEEGKEEGRGGERHGLDCLIFPPNYSYSCIEEGRNVSSRAHALHPSLSLRPSVPSGQYLLVIGQPYDEVQPPSHQQQQRSIQRVLMAHQTIDLSEADPLREGMWTLEVVQAWEKEAPPEQNLKGMDKPKE